MFLLRALRISINALFAPSLPLSTRLYLLLLQPISLLTYTIEWLRARRFPHSHEIRIPLKRVPGHTVRALVYLPSPQPPSPQETGTGKAILRPLHLNIHGGAFLGGLPEGNARFCRQLAQEAGAVVVSTTYRYAPVHTFPDAHEDVQDVAEYLVHHAVELFNADPACFTVSGFSAGGNLALGISQGCMNMDVAVRGSVVFYGVVDFRIPPWDKPIPKGFPEKDPLSFLQPLFDTYAGPNRARDISNPLLHPTLADIRTLPQNMLFIVGEKDILHDETVTMTERLQYEAERVNLENGVVERSRGSWSEERDTGKCPDGKKVVVRTEVFAGQIHGWLEMPSAAIDVKTRTKAFGDAIGFLRGIHRAYGFNKE
ncbi:putative lipase/esterase family protein [Aspergillus mulundensis]|uniref:Alpha/beta hydrolase fold-3 domain-containing protein n=1 Tax=Aspergillus mulundensis TaxID=1810919 RepID=A0A3D8QVC6_9EURO|nr:hypothetical protein DSM5745_09552 [Aspergillus mulundensis]RDW65813.1 hypothetical protein DSM5745_09552 [Aspergillus mulundensis]